MRNTDRQTYRHTHVHVHTHTHTHVHTHTEEKGDQGGGIQVPQKLQVTNDKSPLVLALT